MTRPNILWIMTDQHNADCLSCAGHPLVRTPNLDRLAQRGARFTQAYCQYPQCTPSRISMLRGQYPHTHRMFGFVGNVGPEPTHMVEHFKQNGYHTGAFGKLHLDPMGHHFGPDRCSPTIAIDWFMARPEGRHYGAYLEANGQSYPTHETHGAPGVRPPQPGPNLSSIPPEHNLEKWTADETIRFIEQSADGDQPFLAYMSFERPHKPVNIPPGRVGQVDPQRVELDPPETAQQLLLKPRICLEGRMDPCSDTWQSPEEFRQLVACYFTVIEMIDEQIGRVLEKLDELGLAENTAIAFCADHGDQAGRKRIFDKCQQVSSNQLTRIPLILCPPGALQGGAERAGRVVDAPVESLDLYPTFCDWSGIDKPTHLEGRSLAGVCEGEAPDAERCAFTEGVFRRSVVKDGWRLVHHHGSSVHELYDLRRDPLEYDNLYLRPGHAQKVDQLKHELIRFLSEPFTAEDTRFVDQVLLPHPVHRAKLTHQRLHRSGCEGGPFVVEGRAIHAIEWKHWTLFYRVDTREHRIYANSDTGRENDLISTPTGRWVYGELRDKLLDVLFERSQPRTYWEPQPLGGEMPTPEQVEAYLSQPLFQTEWPGGGG